MYAVIETGGKQYRVQPGDIFQVEKLEGDVGSAVSFDRVLFVSKANAESPQVWVGKPLLSGASVQAEIVGQGRGEKILIIKMRRRKQYRRTQGHRQYQTQLLVTGLDNGSGEKLSLADSDKQEKLNKFRTNLKPKGEAFSPRILGSRKRLAAAAQAGMAPKKAAAAESVSEATPSKAKAAPKKKSAKATTTKK